MNSDCKTCKKCNQLEIPDDSDRTICYKCLSGLLKKPRKCIYKCRTCREADEDDYYYKTGKYVNVEEEKKEKRKVRKQTEAKENNALVRMKCKKGNDFYYLKP